MSDQPTADLLELTARIVSAHIGNNQVAADALPGLIEAVYRSLADAGEVEPAPEPRAPAVPIKKSVFPDFIICLEDGKKLKLLKRHLAVRYGLTPQEYRAKWSLPANYPMAAPNYAAWRSTVAKTSGLGRKQVAEPEVAPAPARRVRRLRG